MGLAITTICAAVLLAVVVAKRMRDRREMERHTITPLPPVNGLFWNHG